MNHSLVNPETLLQHDFGDYHPFKIYRLGLAYGLIQAYNLTEAENITILTPRMATDPEAMGFHTQGYLECLRLASEGTWTPHLFTHGLGSSDNPVFAGVFDWAMSVAGASIRCAEEILSGRSDRAFNMAGGLHHAMPSRASGFCHINDGVLAIQTLTGAGKRVAYVDIDAHHGDGVERAFYDRSDVLTISIHQTGRTIFPGTGFANDMGEGDGRGYAVNIPLSPGAGDDAYERAFGELVLPLLKSFQPDVLVTQLGADAVLGDIVANLRLSLRGFERCLKQFRALAMPWIALGGGGYDVANVVRAWTMAWATMLDCDLPDEIPDIWMAEAATYDVCASSLRGTMEMTSSPEHVLDDLSESIEHLRRRVLQPMDAL
ncbi:acetoin utilization protein AcuC [Candidatus Bipolaricaulota bacterium]|nr:acetoin utilization protein AcuC [Candidatus Bipolaricaulota bacterium]